MIRVIKGNEVKPSVWEFSVEGYDLRGRSRQPLLDACRALKSLGVDPKEGIGAFREGRDEADMTCTVEVGAATTVSEPDKGTVRFTKYQAFDFAGLRENAGA